ncbi:MAG TPA: molybdate ABC transporter substrate-binding protein [Thermoanaerobaculia bacterium]|jgi:molybdate transport system substrate-binding protein|nr:molybdate ABC transporter substrate-binding protein [Thermoanaerobaculia bacterium]
MVANRALARVAVAAACLAAVPALPGGVAPAGATTVQVAAAASVEPALRELATDFERASGHRLAVSSGSTGKLAAQVAQGAPFAVLLAADAEHPEALEKQGLAVAGTRVTFARGRLVLWSAQPGLSLGPETLRAGRFAHLAIADPDVAPYGAAAVAALRRLGVYEAVAPKLVRGESVGQTFAFVKSGAAELGFVALSQLGAAAVGSRWPVPEELHPPLLHQAVLLAKGKDDPAARAFLAFLVSEPARAVLRHFGYTVP